MMEDSVEVFLLLGVVFSLLMLCIVIADYFINTLKSAAINREVNKMMDEELKRLQKEFELEEDEEDEEV